MEEKEIEKKLKKDAEEVRTKDFSERWRTIQTRLNAEEVGTKETVAAEELVTDTGNNQQLSALHHKNKLLVILIAIFIVCLLALAIVLPITFSNKGKIYFNEPELEGSFVELDTFYAELNEANIDIIDIDGYEVELTQLYFTPDRKAVVGGRVEFTDESNGHYVLMRFYANNVLLNSKYILGEYEEYRNISGINIKYQVIEDNEVFTTKAELIFNHITYRLECLSLEPNVSNLFDNLFK